MDSRAIVKNFQTSFWRACVFKPIRISGSAIELVFSSLRQMKGGVASLTESKFESAKANHMIHELNDIKTRNQYFGSGNEVKTQSTRSLSDLPLKRKLFSDKK
eukprot:Pompholyxophrys_punicea_v1_NODE_550_length_1703_cov_7.223301.p2 type:complete len:103 gc:universal NODE_550_length_1703_cov_7.223301:366-58(-)